MNKRIAIGLVASVTTAAGGALWPGGLSLMLIALGVVTNGILISAMSAAFETWERMIRDVFQVVQEFEEMAPESKGFGVAANRLRSALRGVGQ